MLNRSKSVHAAISITFAVALVAPFAASGDSSWLDRQLSMSDGYSQPYEATSAGPEGRRANTVTTLELQSSWLNQQLSISDGYSPPSAEPARGRGSAFEGASLQLQPNDSFVQRGLRITDGTTE